MKKISLLFAVAIVFVFGFMLMEGTVVTAATGTASAGFNVSLSVTDVISLTCSVASSTYPVSIGTIAGYGVATSTADQFNCTTTSNSATGYTMTARATSTPAMNRDNTDGKGTDYFEDLMVGPVYNLGSVAAANTSTFAFSASTTIDTYLAADFKSTASVCQSASGNQDNTHCWRTASSTPISVIAKTVASATGGDVVKYMFKGQTGSTRNQRTGTYNAHMIIEVANQ